MNARFWIRWNGDWVKLTLEPGQQIALAKWRDTDEGWSDHFRCYRHDGDAVACEIIDRSRDCDGVHEETRELACPLADLKANIGDDGDEGRPPLPAWNLESTRCRDQFAEAAGY
jgi:hypothetical protein